MPQTHEDIKPNTLNIEQVACVNGRQLEDYVAKLSVKTKMISQLTSATSRRRCEITSPLCIYKLGYSFPLQEFVREILCYYNLGPNKWIILSAFDKFLRLVGLKPIVNIFRTCYNLIGGTDNDNNIY